MNKKIVDAVMFSINPEPSYYILNGVKDIEVRKMFNIKWAKKQIEKHGGFYGIIYCTKNDKGLVFDEEGKGLVNQELFPYGKGDPEHDRLLNGKVIAKFWCNKVEKISLENNANGDYGFETDSLDSYALKQKACLTFGEMKRYLKCPDFYGYYGYAIHITKLERFVTPKALKDFYCRSPKDDISFGDTGYGKLYAMKPMERAPQSWGYIQYENEEKEN